MKQQLNKADMICGNTQGHPVNVKQDAPMGKVEGKTKNPKKGNFNVLLLFASSNVDLRANAQSLFRLSPCKLDSVST